MAVNATPSPTANSYVSNSDAIAIWQNDPRKQDYPAVEADQDRFLMSATAILDDMYGAYYKGTLQNANNALYWPRTGVEDPRTKAVATSYSAYPPDIARATAMQAYHLYKHDRQVEKADRVSANKREKLDGVGEIERGSTSEQSQATVRPVIHPEVSRVMRNFVNGVVSPYVSVMSRG
jgi:hypothetical protein